MSPFFWGGESTCSRAIVAMAGNAVQFRRPKKNSIVVKRGHGFDALWRVTHFFVLRVSTAFIPPSASLLYYSFLGRKLAFTDFAMRIIARALRSTSSSVVAHEETEIRIAVWPCHSVPPHQQVPSS